MSDEPDFSVTHTTSGTVQVLHLVGVLNDAAGPILDRAVKVLPGLAQARVVLDISRLRYASSAGIAAFVSLHRRLKGGGGVLVLAQPSESLAEMLVTLNLSTLIPIEATVDAGILTAYARG
jgi:anti-anti-sigma factor